MSRELNSAPDAKAFIERVTALPKTPGVSLDSVLAPSVENEAELRRIYAQDRKHARIADPYVGLVSVFDAPVDIRTTRARVVKDEDDLSAKHIFPLDDGKRRKDGEPCMVNSLEEFQKNWSIFTEGSLSQLTDWNNVVAGGGSVLGCLLPLSEKNKESKRDIRKFYHSQAYPTSDVDLFIWGLNAEQAEVKINQIYEAVRNSIPWDVTCVRTKHAVSIHSQYPYRSIQIVLRLYHSPAEILAGFDVDSACVAYDGSRILANPRSIVAMMRQANTVDITRRSPSYEIRLSKYATRGFEIYVPNLRCEDVDPTIFERSINRITGLARLLVLEKLAKPEARQSYLELRRSIRSRANNSNVYQARNRRKRKYKNDLKDEEEIGGLEFNDYDLASLHIPYGPGWTAKRIEKLVYQTDLGTNSSFNPKNKSRRLHRHPAFFGTMKECIEDICGYCPEPKNKEEKELQDEEDKIYVRGRIAFMEEDPGRQSMTGSFNPIDVGEWSEQAYLGPIEKFFFAIAALDRNTVKQTIASGQVDINRRDHVGRTALHMAVLCKASDICSDLIDAGVRMTARVADGRTALHIAAHLGLSAVVEKMIQKSSENAAKKKKEEELAEAAKAEDIDVEKADENDSQGVSSEDDWSSGDEDTKDKKETEAAKGPDDNAAIPEDNAEEPDILDINVADWDFAFTPLAYGILGGSKRTVQILLNAGADPKLATKPNDFSAPVFHPLTIAALNEDEDKSLEVVDQLLRAGASSAQADARLFSIFHTLVCSGKARIVERILYADPKAISAINVPAFSGNKFFYPLVTAIMKGNYAIAVLLIAYGAKIQITADDLQKAKNMVPSSGIAYYGNNDKTPHELDYLKDAVVPAEAAVYFGTYFLELLVKLHAQVSVPINRAHQDGRYNETSRKSILDWVATQAQSYREEIAKKQKQIVQQTEVEDVPEIPVSFADFRRVYKAQMRAQLANVGQAPNDADMSAARNLAYYEEMQAILEKSGAKTYGEIYPGEKANSKPTPNVDNETEPPSRIQYKFSQELFWRADPILPHMLDQYDALYEACWAGENEKIEELCLPRKGTKLDKAPIQIAVATAQRMRRGISVDDDGIYTPLSVAIQARKWDSARLIIAIAIAQWTPPEDEAKESKFTTRDIDLGDDTDDDESDVESLASDASEERKAREIGSFTDLSTRTSAVKSTVPASMLLDYSVSGHLSRDGNKVFRNVSVLGMAARDGDLEAFVNICEMMKLLPKPQLPSKDVINDILQGDSPEVLDEYIRRTGLGIEIRQEEKDEQEELLDTTVRKQSKVYLGLSVHGKKRKDLAMHGDAHANIDNAQEEIPFLWLAIRCKSKKIIEYLGGSKPLEAYRYYASTASDEHAIALRKSSLDKLLPTLLGITPNSRNETALTAVFTSHEFTVTMAQPGIQKKVEESRSTLSMLKYVLFQFPLQTQIYLHSSLRFVRWNTLMIAVLTGCKSDVIEFLLSSGVSADDTDARGYNIYHMVCQNGDDALLEYFLGRLPEETSSRLFKQLSREEGNTPIMLAVKSSRFVVLEKLFKSKLSAVKDALYVRDRKGSLPVHVAVHQGWAKIVSLIIANSGSDSLYCENAVGETPIETATIQWLLSATRNAFDDGLESTRAMNMYNNWRVGAPLTIDRLPSQVKVLKDVLTQLERDGKLSVNSDLKKVFESFVDYLDRKREEGEAMAAKESSTTTAMNNNQFDKTNTKETLKVVSSFISTSVGERQIVHLIDVQNSVRNSIDRATKPLKGPVALGYHGYRRRNRTLRRKFEKGKELPDEADEEEEAKERMWRGILRFRSELRVANDP